MQAIYDAAKRFTEDVENLGGLRSAIEAHDAAEGAASTTEPAPPTTLAEGATEPSEQTPPAEGQPTP